MSKAEGMDTSKDKDFLCHNYIAAAMSWSDLTDNVGKYHLGMLEPDYKVKGKANWNSDFNLKEKNCL